MTLNVFFTFLEFPFLNFCIFYLSGEIFHMFMYFSIFYSLFLNILIIGMLNSLSLNSDIWITCVCFCHLFILLVLGHIVLCLYIPAMFFIEFQTSYISNYRGLTWCSFPLDKAHHFLWQTEGGLITLTGIEFGRDWTQFW